MKARSANQRQKKSAPDYDGEEHLHTAGSHIHAPRWPAVACGAAAAVGVAWAAAFVSVHGVERDVGVAAWVAAAVVGASATISSSTPRPLRRKFKPTEGNSEAESAADSTEKQRSV